MSSLIAVPLSWVGLRSSVARRCRNTSLTEPWTIRSTQSEGDARLSGAFEVERSPSPTIAAFSFQQQKVEPS